MLYIHMKPKIIFFGYSRWIQIFWLNSILGRLEESIVDSDSISERFESQSRIASTIEDLENIEDLADDISIPSTLSATVREPSRIGSSRKFQETGVNCPTDCSRHKGVVRRLRDKFLKY